MLQRFTESLCMPSSFYKDITETAPKSMKEAVSKANKDYCSRFTESVNKSTVKQILKESNVEDSIVQKVLQSLEDAGINAKEHRIYKIPISRINDSDHPNGNGRAYTLDLWKNVRDNQEHAWKGLCGLADHPSDDEPGKFRDSSIVWLGMEIDDLNKLVYGIGSFVGPYGHLAQEIIDCGGRVGNSSSGFGELMADGVTVNPDTYQIERLADLVLNPSQDVYGDINGEQNNNIEYTKQEPVLESINYNSNNSIRESNRMENNGVKSALSKVEEKELRKHINNYLEENTKISNPVKQLEDLEEIQALIREGQLTDLEDGIVARLEEVHKKIEESVEFALKMKESEVTVSTPDGVSVTVKGEETSDTPVLDVVADAAETVADEIDTDTDVEETEEGEDFLESVSKNLTKSQAKALRKYIESSMKDLKKDENPLKTYTELTDLLATVREGKLGADLEEDVVAKLEETRKQMEKDIADARNMKSALGSEDLSQITESTQNIMKTGEVLAEQITDYKALCEALTKRNSEILKEHKATKLKLELATSKEEDSVLNRNKKVVELEEKCQELQSKYDTLNEEAGKKAVELEESLATYKKGNALLEKKNGLLETKLSEAKKEFKKLKEAYSKKVATLSKKVELANSLLEESKDSLDKYKGMESEISNLKEMVKSLNESNKALKESVNSKSEKETLTENVNVPAEPESPKTLSEAISFKENGVENLWNDLHTKYGESIEPFEKKIRSSKTVREAQQNWLSVMSEVDSNLKAVRETTFAGKGMIGTSERLATLREHGMVTPDEANKNDIQAINDRFLSKLHEMGLQ